MMSLKTRPSCRTVVMLLGLYLMAVPSGCSSNESDSKPTNPAEPSEKRTEPWWCLCYKLIDQTDMTACRETASDCEQLRQLTESGNSDILARSAQTGCEAVLADHPGDLFGTR